MAIKLLSKSDIASKKAGERRQSVDEGVKVAHRVDNLRKVAANEEQALEKFRKESMKAVKDEISAKIKERDALISEVKLLEGRKVEALKPLTAEKVLAENVSRALEAKKAELIEEEKRGIIRDKTLDKRQKDLAALEKSVEKSRVLANKKLQEAEENSKEAEQALKNAHTTFDNLSKQMTDREKDIAKKEKVIEAREREVDAKLEAIKKQRQEIVAHQTNLASREAALQSNLNRK